MSLLGKVKPKFWDHVDVAAGPYKDLFNFRRIWKLAILLTAGVALIPLIFLTAVDYKVTQRSHESEILLRTSRLVSNMRRNISFFLSERMSALDFIAGDNTFEMLNDSDRLAEILDNLRKAFGGGFTDLGVIDPLGYQRTYVGPYNLKGHDYRDEGWYTEVLDRGVYVSDVFLGHRQVPHLVIAVKRGTGSGLGYVLRATLDMERFDRLLSEVEVSGFGDVFIINQEGTLQTPSGAHGKVLEKISLPVPAYSDKTKVYEEKSERGEKLIVGYAYIAQTPFILMAVKQKKELMRDWRTTRLELIGFSGGSILIILVVILGVATFLVEQIYVADQKRVISLHQVEYANKMATIGRLAASVAHEINNPLAIINEKAGLIKDMFTLRDQWVHDEKLMGLVDSVISSVDRCAVITRRLLSFMRTADKEFRPVNLKEIVQEVLAFLGKEAEYRSIGVIIDAPEDLPQIESDKGKLQEVFLNVVNNSFAAVNDGGHVDITVERMGKDIVLVTISDDGCGIAEEDLDRVFEPFFSTKTNRGGTGLGLSITSAIVEELGGTISVRSVVGKGTSFLIELPIRTEKMSDDKDPGTVGGR